MLTANALGDGPGLGAVLALPIVQRLVLITLLVGIFEELLFRGAVLHAFEVRYGVTISFFVSSLLFGLMHDVNWIDGQTFTNTTLQVAHAAGAGLMYAAIVLATRSIWFSVAYHALWDCSVFLIGIMGADPSVEDIASGGDSRGIVQIFLLVGLEPIYGLLLFWWWRRSGAPH
jgi:membrane protease YdiL (CAAX protease family)